MECSVCGERFSPRKKGSSWGWNQNGKYAYCSDDCRRRDQGLPVIRQSEYLPYWFYDIYQPYLKMYVLNCTENLEKMLERMAVDGFGETYLLRIRRYFQQGTHYLVSAKGRLPYSEWLKWHYKINGRRTELRRGIK